MKLAEGEQIMDEIRMKLRAIIMQFNNQYTKWCLAVLFILIYHFKRIYNYTILGDDVIRIVDAKTLPLKTQLFRPFSEHIAPSFELLTAISIRTFGNHLNLTAFLLTMIAIGCWLLFLIPVAMWTRRVTSSDHIACLTFILTGISTACLEIPWWFSAATYSLSAGFIFLVMYENETKELLKWNHYLRIAIFTALAMSFSALGLLAVVIAGGISVLRNGIQSRSIKSIFASVSGLLIYWLVCRWLGGDLLSSAVDNNRNMTDIIQGLFYAFSVPGNVTLPLFFGLDARFVTNHFSFAIGIPTTIILILSITFALRNNPLKWPLIVLILGPCLVLYPTRAGLVSSGRWQEPDFIYFWTSRYHLFSIVAFSVGFSTIIINLLKYISSDKYKYTFLLIFLAVFSFFQQKNMQYWSWMMDQPDQYRTLAALDRLRQSAQQEGINQSDLLKIFPPVRRGWNASVLELRPDAFPLVRLIGDRTRLDQNQIQIDSESELLSKKYRLLQKMSNDDWLCLNEGRLLNLSSAIPASNCREIPLKPDLLEKSVVDGTHRWLIQEWGGFIEFELTFQNEMELLFFEKVNSNSPVIFQWSSDTKTWDDRNSAWFETKPADHLPVIQWVSFSIENLFQKNDRISFPKTIRMRVKPLQPGQIQIELIQIGKKKAPSD